MRSLDNDEAQEAGVKRPKPELIVIQQPPGDGGEKAKSEHLNQESTPVKQLPSKTKAATGILLLDKERPPIHPHIADEAAVQRSKGESPPAKQSPPKTISSTNDSSKSKNSLASVVSPVKRKDTNQDIPADPKQRWFPKLRA